MPPAASARSRLSILSKCGFQVTAVTGRREEAGYLKNLGASEIIRARGSRRPRETIGKRALGRRINAVGSTTLANVLSMTRCGGAAAACGSASDMDLPNSVAPFILRGIALLGIDSVMRPRQIG